MNTYSSKQDQMRDRQRERDHDRYRYSESDRDGPSRGISPPRKRLRPPEDVERRLLPPPSSNNSSTATPPLPSETLPLPPPNIPSRALQPGTVPADASAAVGVAKHLTIAPTPAAGNPPTASPAVSVASTPAAAATAAAASPPVTSSAPTSAVVPNITATSASGMTETSPDNTVLSIVNILGDTIQINDRLEWVKRINETALRSEEKAIRDGTSVENQERFKQNREKRAKELESLNNQKIRQVRLLESAVNKLVDGLLKNANVSPSRPTSQAVTDQEPHSNALKRLRLQDEFERIDAELQNMGERLDDQDGVLQTAGEDIKTDIDELRKVIRHLQKLRESDSTGLLKSNQDLKASVQVLTDQFQTVTAQQELRNRAIEAKLEETAISYHHDVQRRETAYQQELQQRDAKYQKEFRNELQQQAATVLESVTFRDARINQLENKMRQAMELVTKLIEEGKELRTLKDKVDQVGGLKDIVAGVPERLGKVESDVRSLRKDSKSAVTEFERKIGVCNQKSVLALANTESMQERLQPLWQNDIQTYFLSRISAPALPGPPSQLPQFLQPPHPPQPTRSFQPAQPGQSSPPPQPTQSTTTSSRPTQSSQNGQASPSSQPNEPSQNGQPTQTSQIFQSARAYRPTLPPSAPQSLNQQNYQLSPIMNQPNGSASQTSPLNCHPLQRQNSLTRPSSVKLHGGNSQPPPRPPSVSETPDVLGGGPQPITSHAEKSSLRPIILFKQPFGSGDPSNDRWMKTFDQSGFKSYLLRPQKEQHINQSILRKVMFDADAVQKYSAVIATSKCSGHAWREIAKLGAPPRGVDWRTVPLYSTGVGTADSFNPGQESPFLFPRPVVYDKPVKDASDVASLIVSQIEEGQLTSRCNGEIRILHLTGDKNGPEVRNIVNEWNKEASQKGKPIIDLHQAVVYEMTRNENLRAEIKALLDRIKRDHGANQKIWLAFFSSLAAQAVIKALREIGYDLGSQLAPRPTVMTPHVSLDFKIATIGLPTAKTVMEEEGLMVQAVGQLPTPDSMLEAILHVERQSGRPLSAGK